MSTPDDDTAKRYRCQFYYKMGDDFADCLEAAETIKGIEEDAVIPQAFRVWAERLEKGAQLARKLAEVTADLNVDVLGTGHVARLIATDEESEVVLDQLVADGVLVEDDEDDDEDEDDEDEDEDEDDAEFEDDDDRLDAANYEFWTPAMGAPVSDYSVFIAETLGQARAVLHQWASDERVIVALIPSMVDDVCWHNPASQEVIALFPAEVPKDELIARYVEFLAQGN